MVCVSTQVMESGVDISFGCVIRLTAGMDSVVQAAGRCNRNGESQTALPVYLLNCADENLGMLQEIQQAKTASIALLDRFHRKPDKYNGNLAGDSAILDYYRLLYREMPAGYQDFFVKWGLPSLYELLSTNETYFARSEDHFILTQAFRTAGQQFQVLEANTTSVIVPYGKGREIIGKLQSETRLSAVNALLEQAKPYQINLYRYQFDMLANAQGLGCDPGERIFWLEEGWYNDHSGLLTEKHENPFWEV